MFKRALFLLLLTATPLSLLACGGQKDEDALMEDDRQRQDLDDGHDGLRRPPRRRLPRRARGGRRHRHGQGQFRGGRPGHGRRSRWTPTPSASPSTRSPSTSRKSSSTPTRRCEWVLVYVKEGVKGTYPAPTEPVTLDQHGCQYRPHVFGIQAGQPLKVFNSDGTLHNIHALPKKNAEFNIGQPFKGMETIKKFENTEVPVRFKCDVHKWMGAYTGVFNHPFFAVTNDQGTFEIKNLPPGNYVIEAWHEKYGTQTQNVTVTGSEPKTVDFNFKG